jgi:hypothetical protein
MERPASAVASHPDAAYAPCWDLRCRLRQASPVDPSRPPLLHPARLLSDRLLHCGKRRVDPTELAALSRLYQRPLGFSLGWAGSALRRDGHSEAIEECV